MRKHTEKHRKRTIPLSGAVKIARSFLTSSMRARELRQHFDEIKTYCMFLGQPRSGHTLVGTLIDAHPHAVLSNELHALKYLRYRFSRDRIFSLIIDRSERFAASGRRDPNYNYFVPNQWHGRFKGLRVIGDKKGAGSADLLDRCPYLLDRLQKTVRVPVRYIHVVRNPYDNISTIARHEENNDLGKAIRRYLKRCEAVKRVLERIDSAHVLRIHHESVIGNPQEEILRICSFLGLEPFNDYVSDCASIVYKRSNVSRLTTPWPEEQIDEVQGRIAEFPFLDGYSFTDET